MARQKSSSKGLQNLDKRRIIFGAILFFGGLLATIACFSFFMNWKQDVSLLGDLQSTTEIPRTLFNKVGVFIGYYLVYRWVGISSVILTMAISAIGFYLFFSLPIRPFLKYLIRAGFWMIWLTIAFNFIETDDWLLSGVVGKQLYSHLSTAIGTIGVVFLVILSLLLAIVFQFNIKPSLNHFNLGIVSRLKYLIRKREKSEKIIKKKPVATDPILDTPEVIAAPITFETKVPTPKETTNFEPVIEEPLVPEDTNSSDFNANEIDNEVAFEVAESPKSYDDEIAEKADKLVEDFGEFDPTLELSNYKPPHLDLLEDHGASVNQISVDKEELSANKDRIVETLNNYNIAIDRITATVGPTVTLYEIVPQAGVRISKIKNLEDDIALSLSALGIRIIAPIPGKGTIGIEVPNKNPSVVSMRSVMASKKFSAASNYDLPIAFGKTIANETFVVDLAKMPHMLMAGATGQGKSVGLNAVITSLLYKKHPAELKFVLVDPKKVELTLYNKIERHFLAKLPGSDEAIITDTKKVINTLNSLCIEMDDRYDLLKNAMVRNIKEYNAKFIKRKLNPNDGHRYLPYIVLVIDEFADLIMTAGKEVETPIARLAQLARAIGIHLIIATQRPSVNVITGIIKANFPARLAFRVTSKIDSRTILDSSGADQLIGRGDMLYTQGSELVRLQCAFVDTPEVEEITSYIGSQRAYASAHLLPEYEDDSSESSLVDDINERDPLFKEAAEIVVQSQQGSTSLIQRKMKIGYNRAGRIIDQLEAAGIVGPFEGSKARQVLFKDVISLQQFFDNQTQ